MSEWRSVETIPKDGTWILVLLLGCVHDVQQLRDGKWRGQCGHTLAGRITHWMPLPELPRASAASAKRDSE